MCFSWTNPSLIVAQSRAIEVPVIQREVAWDTYKSAFKATLIELKKARVKGAVFGDIHVKEHFDWVNKVCNEVGIRALALTYITATFLVTDVAKIVTFKAFNYT
ncbi:MAG: hypothetical protein QW794_02060 [Thermosphaera sp.]